MDFLKALNCLYAYYEGLFSFLVLNTPYGECNLFSNDTRAKVQIFALYLTFFMWNKPHYRSKSFQEDLINNLQNVAVPGTGIPLSLFSRHYWIGLFFVLVLNPLVCLFGAFNKYFKKDKADGHSSISMDFIDHLLHPSDWFSFWQLNCRLTSYTSLITQNPEFQQENKWIFLTDGRKLGVPVTPILELESIVCKNINIEGGLGINFYKNAMYGGEFIIQEKLNNADWLKKILPSTAPLSTMRIITTSCYMINHSSHPTDKSSNENNQISSTNDISNNLPNNIQNAEGKSKSNNKHKNKKKSHNNNSTTTTNNNTNNSQSNTVTDKVNTSTPVNTSTSSSTSSSADVMARSATLRLGLAKSNTDHASVLFNVNLDTGEVMEGVSNLHWYQLGLAKALSCPWLPPSNVTSHPDPPYPPVTGTVVPSMKEALQIVIDAHRRMMPNVPIVGWDVAFTDKGIFLLEVNLSCNVFRGIFDIPSYISFVDSFFSHLNKIDRQKTTVGTTKT